MIKLIYILFAMIFVLTSCGSDNTDQVDNSGLVGEWEWTRTDGGFDYHIHETPESIGNTYQLYLNSDFSYVIKKNDVEISSGTYQLSLEESISGGIEKFITYSNIQQIPGVVISGIIFVSEPNKLNVSDNNPDGIGSTFEKIE